MERTYINEVQKEIGSTVKVPVSYTHLICFRGSR